MTLEHSLLHRKQFDEFAQVIEEYFVMGHAEDVPQSSLDLPTSCVLPSHACRAQGF